MPKRSSRQSVDAREHIYAPSSSSEEDWGDDSWEVDGIIGEHISTRGERRYKIAWGGWTRSDGTNWTWEKDDGTTMSDLSGMLKQWRKEKVNKSMQYVNAPLVSPFYPYVIPEDENVTNVDEGSEPTSKLPEKKKLPVRYAFTELTHQAHKMGLDLRDETIFAPSKSLPSAFERLRAMRAKREEALKAFDVTLQDAVSQCLHELGPAPQKEGRYQAQQKLSLQRRMNALQISKNIPKPARALGAPLPVKQPERSSSRSNVTHMFNFTVDHNQPSGSRVQAEKRPSRPLPKWGASKIFTLGGTQAAAVSQSPTSARSSPSGSAQRKRDALQAQWSTNIRAAGAASVIIVNEVDAEEIPAINPNTFKYLESDYIYGPGVTRPADEFMGSCDCRGRCTATFCSCQDDSEIQDDEGISKSFAYDDKGLFAFSDTILSYVIECNKNCHCDMSCRSRVAQRPRVIPIEIFRTERCGWGARSTVALPRGTVLGVYTGELISRGAAETLSLHRASYIADLDFLVSGSQSGYSVDAYYCGNWTRFVNHSCNPVCSLFSVTWDSVPAMHQPKLAFVASRDIPARTELTIDYRPQARKGKGRAKRKTPDTPDCMCGSENCRGYIY